jgi:hypothetical protein
VAKLEREMVEVRYMAGRTDREVSDLQMVLRGHTGVLNAIRQDQVDHGEKLTRLEAEMRGEFANVRAEMGSEFADVRTEMRSEFADVRTEMRTGFGALAEGQAKITALITQHIEECEKK